MRAVDAAGCDGKAIGWSTGDNRFDLVTFPDLRAFCGEHLAAFKVPEYVELRSEPLPRNPAGKVLKNLLREGGAASAFAPSTADDSAL